MERKSNVVNQTIFKSMYKIVYFVIFSQALLALDKIFGSYAKFFLIKLVLYPLIKALTNKIIKGSVECHPLTNITQTPLPLNHFV
jgi:hypothetical protein